MNGAVHVWGARRAVGRRPAMVVVVLCVLFAMSTGPVFAGYSWCSRDPVITFTRDGALLAERVVDVQLAVNNAGALLDDVTATLEVTTPRNVQGAVVLDRATETLFNIETTFDAHLRPASTASYDIVLEGLVPTTDDVYDTALVITNVNGGMNGGQAVACQGRTGKAIRAKVHFAPFEVYCQEESGWVSVLIGQ